MKFTIWEEDEDQFMAVDYEAENLQEAVENWKYDFDVNWPRTYVLNVIVDDDALILLPR